MWAASQSRPFDTKQDISKKPNYQIQIEDINNLSNGSTIGDKPNVNSFNQSKINLYNNKEYNPYTIVEGDTLYRIGRRLGLGERQLRCFTDLVIKANPGLNPNRLQIGEIIYIPPIDLIQSFCLKY